MADAPPAQAPHRPIYRQPANATERRARDAGLPGCYHKQGEWRSELEKLHFLNFPQCMEGVPHIKELGARPCFLIIHLFSGHRRQFDFHDHLQNLCSAGPFEIRILSMDTAVSELFGDLRHEEAPWRLLHRWYSTGRVAATLAGSPCETFSEARHHPVQGPDGQPHEGPRVLRSAEALWGLPGRTCKELRQLHQGSSFALQVMWSAAMAALHGGLYISEHPAPPQDATRASVWTAPLMCLIRTLPPVRFQVLSQWLWGAATPKPTGFLTVNIPHFKASMEQWKVLGLTKPSACGMGLNPEGEFRTAPMKAYPPALCGGLAQAIYDQLHRQVRHGHLSCCSLPPSELLWLQQAAELSAYVDGSRGMKPDFQDL